MNEQPKNSGGMAVATVQNQTGSLTAASRFILKLLAGVWSLAQLNREKQSALQNWHRACALTDVALANRCRAQWKLEQFDLRLKALEPTYRSRYQLPLHSRRRKLENAYNLARHNFDGLNRQEERFIKRLITLERLKSALAMNKTK